MTKKDFFILIIKLFGLYSIITALFISLPQNLTFVFMDFGVHSIIYLTIILTVIIGLFVFLLFKSHHVVRLLKLEKGFDTDSLELGSLTTLEIVKIAVLIIGGFLIIDNLPIFIQQTLKAFYSEIQIQTIESINKWNWFVNGANILIGYLLITNLNIVSRLLNINVKAKG